LACFMISFHNLLSLHFSLQFCTSIFCRSSSTWFNRRKCNKNIKYQILMCYGFLSWRFFCAVNCSNLVDTNMWQKNCYNLKYGEGAQGGAVVEALHYKLEGHGIDSRWSHWNFSLT
jgi:hypothetical protein